MPANLHPFLVHFPIALLLTSIVLYWAGLRWENKGFEQAYWYTHILGLAGTLFTIISGFVDARDVLPGDPALATLNTHKVLGIATLLVFSALAVCHVRSKGEYSPAKRVLHTVIQLIGVGLILAVGFFGGELVYVFGVGVAVP